MSINIAYSTSTSVIEAVNDLKTQIQIQNPKFVIYFASTNYNPAQVAAETKKAFLNSEVMGCSTSGEIVSGKMLSNSIVAMAFDKNTIEDVKIEVIENLKESPDPYNAFEKFKEYYKVLPADMDFEKYLGLILIDGLSNSEEKLMERIGAGTNVNFIGGSAGDDLKFKETYVYANGKSYTNAAILAIVKPVNGFEILKTQSFNVLKNKFIATKVNEGTREILELDNFPAVEVYSKAVSVDPSDAASVFMTYPFGVMVDNDPFVRSPQQVSGKGIKFYCNVAEGTELTLLKSEDIVKETREAVTALKANHSSISGILNFNCILRTLELQSKKQTDEYGKIFTDIPTIGFSTYGEEFIGHINQTAILVAFK